MALDSNEIKHYDLQGYSRDDHIKRAERCFTLRDFEVHSINEIITGIKKGAQKGRYNIEQLGIDLAYLDHLESKLLTISKVEEREGLVNLPLKRDLAFVANLKIQVLGMLQKISGPVLGG